MSLRRELRARIAALLGRTAAERELDEELRFHLEMEIEKNRRAGMSRTEARRRARIDFGGVEKAKEDCRDQRGARGAEDLLRDLRHALRRLLREPSFSAPGLVTLTLAFGGVLALFGVLWSVVLRPLPYPEPERLVRLWSSVPGVGVGEIWGVAKSELLHFERDATSFEALGLYRFGASTLGEAEGGRPDERVRTVQVSLGLLRALRVLPAHGRRPAEADARPGAAPAVWLSQTLWDERFGGDEGVVGRRLVIDGRPAEVAGILPSTAALPEELEVLGRGAVGLWSVLEIDPAERPKSSHVFRAIGRLAPGVSLEQASAELGRLTRGLPEALPAAYTQRFMESTGFETQLVPLRSDLLGGIEPTLWMLLATAALVFLVACANVAGLLVARSEARQQDGAVRRALGATGGRLLQESLAEMLLLCATSAAGGLLLAQGALRALRALAPADLPRVDELEVGGESVVLAALLCVAVALALGWLQARRMGRASLSPPASGRGATAGANARFRKVLVIAQVALTTVLLAGAGMLAQSYLRLHRVGAGFEAKGALTFSVLLPEASYPSLERVVDFYREASERLAALPGVESFGLGSGLPLEGLGCSVVAAEDAPPAAESELPCVPVHLVTPGHLRALGVPVEGRETEWRDLPGGRAGAVVSEAFARRQWPGEEALGKRVRIGRSGSRAAWSQEPFVEVVGLAGDVRGEGLDRPATEDVYLPLVEETVTPLGGPPRRLTGVLRVRERSPRSLEGPVRATLAELEPRAPLVGFETLEERVRGSLARRALILRLLVAAAGLALVLGAVGIFGVLSYLVARRRAEIGLRLALGARASRVAGTAIAEALRLAAVGVALGAAAAVWATRALRGLLYGVEPGDPGTLALVGLVLLIVALVAALGPARRMARVDPAEALRQV